jgi:hypothetical protein
MVALTREERIRRVLEHHNQGMGTREISKLLRMSFTDIAKILKDADKEKESEQQRTRQEFLSSQAYKLFSEGKSPVQVAIELNIRASDAIIFQREYWDLEGLHNLNRIYEETKVDTWHIVNLWKSVKSAGMGVQHVIKTLGIANNHLPSVEYTYETLKREVEDLEAEKRNSARIYQELTDQILSMRKRLDSLNLDCERELAQRDQLYQKRMKIEAGVRHFENNNEYLKIKQTVKQEVECILTDRRQLLKLALLSLTDSMKNDPDKYSRLIYHNSPSTANYNSQYYDTSSYGQQQQYPSQAYIDMLLEEAEKLYNKLVKKLVDETITDYAFSTSSSLLPVLPPFEERESDPTTAATNQTHMHTEEHRFSQSEIDNGDQDK